MFCGNHTDPRILGDHPLGGHFVSKTKNLSGDIIPDLPVKLQIGRRMLCLINLIFHLFRPFHPAVSVNETCK